MTEQFHKNLIASCGMNCGVCLHYLREKNKCGGCNSGRKVNGRQIKCGIMLCEEKKGSFCFECQKFPCERLKMLDQRYQAKYGMSEIENLEYIHDKGIEGFLESQHKIFQSSKGTFCVHDRKYY